MTDESQPIVVDVDGPNGSGKSTLNRFAAEMCNNHFGYEATVGIFPEPPDMVVDGHPDFTWRGLLKSGQNDELLIEITAAADIPDISQEEILDYARVIGFTRYRRELSEKSGDLEAWGDLKIEIIGEEGGDLIIVFRDRGPLSTFVYQMKSGLGIGYLIHQLVGEGAVRKDDMTIIVFPRDAGAIGEGTDIREEGEVDVHEGDPGNELYWYKQQWHLWQAWAERFMRLENDINMGTTHLALTSLAVSAATVALRVGENVEYLKWYGGTTETTCYSPVNPFEALSIFEDREGFSYEEMLEVLSKPRYVYQGTPLSFISGDFGLVWPDWTKNVSQKESGLEFILVQGLKDNVEPWVER